MVFKERSEKIRKNTKKKRDTKIINHVDLRDLCDKQNCGAYFLEFYPVSSNPILSKSDLKFKINTIQKFR